MIKVKLSLCITIKHYVVKMYGGVECIDPCSHELGTSWKLVVSFMPQLLYSGENISRYSLNNRLDVQSGQHGEETNILPLPGFELLPFGGPAHSQLNNK
jgi:hypothetical protein